MPKRTENNDGFTFLEVMTVIFIIGILVGIAVAVYTTSVGRASRIACVANQRILNGAIIAYNAENDSADPDTLADLAPFVSGAADFRCAADRSVSLILIGPPGAQNAFCEIHP